MLIVYFIEAWYQKLCDQREQVRALINEESSVFPVDNENIGNVTPHQMVIHLNDKTPVQQNHNSIPRTLYDELKNYIEDVLKKKWIINSQSPYSSPVVAFRKEDGTLQIFCDYGKLNSRAIPNQHSLSRM